MADEATTMRDPFFYRWHAFVDDLYQKFKESESVTRYTRSQVMIIFKIILHTILGCSVLLYIYFAVYL